MDTQFFITKTKLYAHMLCSHNDSKNSTSAAKLSYAICDNM